MTSQKRHRHFVALPLFLAVLGLSLVPLSGTTSSLTAAVRSAHGMITLSDGTQILPGEDSVLEEGVAAPFLHRGSALVRSESIVQVRTSHCDVLAMAGAFHLITGEEETTVSALTAPVIVSVSGQRALVPVGMQMRIVGPFNGLSAGFAAWMSSRGTMPLPEHFFREQLAALRAFPVAHDALPAGREDLPPRVPVSALALPMAQERSAEAWREDVLGALRFRIEAQDDDAARLMLKDEAFRPAFADARSLSALVVLAGRVTDGTAGLRPLLLPFLADRHDLWLLAAMHPTLHTGAWTAGIPSLTDEEYALLSFGLPMTDRAPQGFSPIVTRWWGDAVLAFIARQRDSLSLIEPLLAHLLPVVHRDVEDGYPERAQTLARTLHAFADPVDRLSPALRSSLEEAVRLTEGSAHFLASSVAASGDMGDLHPAVSSSAPALQSSKSDGGSSSSSLPPLDPHERIAVVTAALEQGGALFSLQTKIDPREDGESVAVRDILFSSPAGDIPFTFDVSVRTMQVSAIVRNGKLLPYPMPMAAFLEWAHQ
jgi:hypothetical protein